MPELPEVETLRRDLDKRVVGCRIESVAVFRARSIRRHSCPEEFVARLHGRAIKSVGRKGKYLLLRLDTTETLIIHLGMSGQLLWAKAGAGDPLERHCHVIVDLSDGGQLRFVDPRTFGQLVVTASPLGTCGRGLLDGGFELAHLGVDALMELRSWQQLAALLAGRTTKVKQVLMDQGVLAGIGNIYSDEILYAAGLRHDRPAQSLSSEEVRRLHQALVEILSQAVECRGSSLADQQYRDLYGELGLYQRHHQVYFREGEPCGRCGVAIERKRVSGRSTFFCPRCQA